MVDKAFEAPLISPDGRYVRKAFIARGSFKKVYKAFDEVECMQVAWNEVPEDKVGHEVELLAKLKHPNIVAIMALWYDEESDTKVFITELLSSGSVRQFIRESSAKKVAPRGVRNWGRQILSGLSYLHTHSVIHRDLKCDNLFINGHSGVVKIGDFGLSCLVSNSYAGSVIGTPEFMAPEIYDESYTNKVDVYSFGMCVLEMVTGQYPYSECENCGQVFRKVTQNTPPRSLTNLSTEEKGMTDVKAIIEMCLRPKDTRPSCDELLTLPFFAPDDACSGAPHENAAGVTILRSGVGSGSITRAPAAAPPVAQASTPTADDARSAPAAPALCGSTGNASTSGGDRGSVGTAAHSVGVRPASPQPAVATSSVTLLPADGAAGVPPQHKLADTLIAQNLAFEESLRMSLASLDSRPMAAHDPMRTLLSIRDEAKCDGDRTTPAAETKKPSDAIATPDAAKEAAAAAAAAAQQAAAAPQPQPSPATPLAPGQRAGTSKMLSNTMAEQNKDVNDVLEMFMVTGAVASVRQPSTASSSAARPASRKGDVMQAIEDARYILEAPRPVAATDPMQTLERVREKAVAENASEIAEVGLDSGNEEQKRRRIREAVVLKEALYNTEVKVDLKEAIQLKANLAEGLRMEAAVQEVQNARALQNALSGTIPMTLTEATVLKQSTVLKGASSGEADDVELATKQIQQAVALKDAINESRGEQLTLREAAAVRGKVMSVKGQQDASAQPSEGQLRAAMREVQEARELQDAVGVDITLRDAVILKERTGVDQGVPLNRAVTVVECAVALKEALGPAVGVPLDDAIQSMQNTIATGSGSVSQPSASTSVSTGVPTHDETLKHLRDKQQRIREATTKIHEQVQNPG